MVINVALKIAPRRVYQRSRAQNFPKAAAGSASGGALDETLDVSARGSQIAIFLTIDI
jgi:hypothetical protein